MTNSEIARFFFDIATILEIKGDNPFRIRAYQRAAQNIESLSQDIESIARQGRLTDISGIGKDLADKIKELLSTGSLEYLRELKKDIPEGVLELLRVPSIGPKTAKLLYEKLKIKSVQGLEKAIAENKLKGIFGIKEKTVENILKGIQLLKSGKERLLLSLAQELADQFTGALSKLKETSKICVAGSLRRHKDTVHDIDILVTSHKPAKIMDIFTGLELVKDVIAHGTTRSSVHAQNDTQVDCRAVEEECFGAALLYFTGSKNFNIKLRRLAIKKGLKINEYGIFKKNKLVAGKTEEEIFKLLGMSYVPAELREDTGEVELAIKNNLPQLVEQADLRGDLHVHSRWSDGSNSINDMALACREKGYLYAALTDHSQSLKVAGGLSVEKLKKKRKEIDRLNRRLRSFRILYGTELDIDSEGNLDYKDDVLKEFDLVVAAIHTGFKQSKRRLTNRLIKACKSKYVHIIAHPTGRLWGAREPYEIDFDELFKAAYDTNTHFEINSFPQRLDLNDINCRRAKEARIKLAISTDSHSVEQLDTIKYGVYTARRGWLEKKDILNTLSLDKLLKEIKK